MILFWTIDWDFINYPLPPTINREEIHALGEEKSKIKAGEKPFKNLDFSFCHPFQLPICTTSDNVNNFANHPKNSLQSCKQFRSPLAYGKLRQDRYFFYSKSPTHNFKTTKLCKLQRGKPTLKWARICLPEIRGWSRWEFKPCFFFLWILKHWIAG